MRCKICGNAENNKAYTAKEMMFGYGDKFSYFQCSICGCLQILEIPLNISKYYPSEYYSFNTFLSHGLLYAIKNFAKKLRVSYAVFNKGILGKMIYQKFPDAGLRCLSEVDITLDSSILDVGCGSGRFLCELGEFGFRNLLGIDPFLKKDIKYRKGLRILRKSINDIVSKWDLIIFNHSFEHVLYPHETMHAVSRLLAQEGVCVIRTPVVPSYFWEHYGVDWVQIDAPRHFFIYSIKAIEILAEKTDFVLRNVVYDSDAFDFWASEQYVKGIPLFSGQSYRISPSHSIFSSRKIRDFLYKAKELNLQRRSGQAVFYLKKK